jgi:hypothetical protein
MKAKKLNMDESADLYSALCDAVCRVALDIPDDDPYRHTSDKSRATANRIMDVLEEYKLIQPWMRVG